MSPTVSSRLAGKSPARLLPTLPRVRGEWEEVSARDQNRAPPPNWNHCTAIVALFQERVGEIETAAGRTASPRSGWRRPRRAYRRRYRRIAWRNLPQE